MRNFLTFAGRSSLDFGIVISGEATYNAPKRDYSSIPVPGRNGDLIIDNGNFKNMPITYPAAAIIDMPQRTSDFFNYLASKISYQRLEDTYHPDEYRLAQYTGGTEVESSGYMNREGKFEIVFNCKPQRFLKSGENAIKFNANGSFLNPTNFEAKPKIRAFGTGAGTVGIGSYLITITEMDEYIDIDCDLMDAFKGLINMNSKVSFNATEISIPTGESGLTFTGDITSVEVTPRWYKI